MRVLKVFLSAVLFFTMTIYADSSVSKQEIKKMENVLQEYVEDEGVHEYEDMLEDIQKRSRENELYEIYKEFMQIKKEEFLGDYLSGKYLYALMLGVAAKANPLDYGGIEAKEELSKIYAQGYIKKRKNSKIFQLINFFEEHGDEIEELSKAKREKIEKRLAEMKKKTAEMKKKTAEMKKKTAEMDKELRKGEEELKRLKERGEELKKRGRKGAEELRRLKERGRKLKKLLKEQEYLLERLRILQALLKPLKKKKK